MDDLSGLEKRLSEGRELSAFDHEAVATVAALIGRVRESARVISQEGVLAAKESGEPIEHPAVKVERMASAEIRGWVKERPDLFGAKDGDGGSSQKVGVFPGLKAVEGG